MLNWTRQILFLFISVNILSACTGVQTYPNSVRAGETAAIAAGWKKDYSRDNISVLITPASGASVVIPVNDPAIRAVVNLYPDPVSSLVISERTQMNITSGGQAYASLVNFTTGDDRDWWQTIVYLDLPAGLTAGQATIEVTNDQGDSMSSVVNIVQGAGSADEFDAEINGPLSAMQLLSLERFNHFEINISSAVIPHAIQLDFSHADDITLGGAGITHVVNPRGDIKNLHWDDDGQNLRVIVTPAKQADLQDIKDFKFYVTGGISGLASTSVSAVDSNGVVIPGVTVDIVER